ncbi:MAG: transketolase family protein [Verrucomicrobia bacterium]|nr:transketolase family protein [Verrucomicrobiota bacterium]MBV9130889.1 transketolase family protein [Verrucomicrobiota bacterium]MBV9644952.1 transketolase family protein [Verrucomicrobiota bacterium]
MKALRDVFGDTLVSLGSTDPNVVVLDADLANSTKADKFAKMYPGRFLQMGIAEQNFVGVAVGLASLGFVPWLSSFTVFFTHRAIDPIRMLVAQTHANVKIGAAYAGLMTGLTGKTHQDVEDLAIMRAMPDMTVLAPADAIEGEAIIRWATEYEGPVYLRLARDAGPNLSEQQYRFVPGKTISLKEGGDVLLISTGPQSVRCLQAAELLQKEGISAGVLHVPSIKPVNKEEIVNAAEKAKVVVTVEEHTIYGGLGGLVAEILSETSPRKVIRFGIEDRWGESAPNDYLLEAFKMSSQRLSERIQKLVA